MTMMGRGGSSSRKGSRGDPGAPRGRCQRPPQPPPVGGGSSSRKDSRGDPGDPRGRRLSRGSQSVASESSWIPDLDHIDLQAVLAGMAGQNVTIPSVISDATDNA